MKRLFFFTLALALVAGFCSVGVAQAGPPVASKVTFAWDANTEEDLAGYRLYQGPVSRYDESAIEAIPGKIDEVCKKGIVSDTIYQRCKESWENFCDQEDPACDKDFFAYESKTDLNKVVTHTIEGIPDGRYFFTLSAFDMEGNESKFSDELEVIIDSEAPEITVGFSAKVEKTSIYQVTVKQAETVE